MRRFLPGAIVGILFGAGLALSDMINPARVLAFLDVMGAWDPTLAYVMGAALIPSAIAYRIRARMDRPVLAPSFAIPKNRRPDPQLLLGAALFGIGWGLVGLCPGPALAGLVLGVWQMWLFVLALLAGMLLHCLVTQTRAPALKQG